VLLRRPSTRRFRLSQAVAIGAVFLAFAAPAHASSGIAALRLCSNCATTGGNLARYDYVVLQAWEYKRIPAIKAANPNTKVLVYKNLPSTSSNAVTNGIDNALLPAGVGYAWANANHPDWFLLDTTGQRIQWSDFLGNWQMDPGNVGYQDAWLANVKGELQRNGWDGVMLDDTFSGENAVWHLGGRTMAKYPTAASYTAAVRSFLARVCPGLTSAGFIALPNIASTTPATWSDWVSLCSGALQEYWTKWGYDGTQQFSGADWDYRQQFLSLTERLGKIFLGVTYAPMNDVRSMRYARASFLLDWDGGPSALAFEPQVDAQDPYSSEWAVDVGKRREVQGRQRVAPRLRQRHGARQPVGFSVADVLARRRLRHAGRLARHVGDPARRLRTRVALDLGDRSAARAAATARSCASAGPGAPAAGTRASASAGASGNADPTAAVASAASDEKEEEASEPSAQPVGLEASPLLVRRDGASRLGGLPARAEARLREPAAREP
jgi:hypothetical protein